MDNFTNFEEPEDENEQSESNDQEQETDHQEEMENSPNEVYCEEEEYSEPMIGNCGYPCDGYCQTCDPYSSSRYERYDSGWNESGYCDY